jgi:hypothetical protein
MDDARKTQFQDRLNRIAAGGPNTMGQVYIGPPDTNGSSKGKKGGSSSGRDTLDNILYPMSIIGAFMVGVFAVFATRFIRFTMMGGELTGENADLWMVVDGVLAIGIVISLRSVFRFGGKALETAKTVGIVAMILTMHNFVHIVPGFFGSVFSPEWTTQIIETTKPNSFLFRGISFMIGEQAEQEVEKPILVQIEAPVIEE